jgi:hypothetical protein
LKPWQALKIGFAQSLALFPGVSRAGATILGGMLFGLNRKTATEFSFFLAIPIMFAATILDVYKSRDILSLADINLFAAGFVTAFLSALVAIRFLLRFVDSPEHKFFVAAFNHVNATPFLLPLRLRRLLHRAVHRDADARPPERQGSRRSLRQSHTRSTLRPVGSSGASGLLRRTAGFGGNVR